MTEETQEKPKRWRGFGRALSKTRSRMADRIKGIFARSGPIDEATLDELEGCLLSTDIGPEATEQIVNRLRKSAQKKKYSSPEQLKEALREELLGIANSLEKQFAISDSTPFVILVVGVNGVGKTTTIGKLAHSIKQSGRTVMLVAGDTFRAAAIDQLKSWGSIIEVPVIAHSQGADAAAVVHDGVQTAINESVDVLIIDTAGRLQTNQGLMDELAKIRRIVQRLCPGAPHECLLVLDATIGQNAIQQTKIFNETVHLSGLILTKLDGTAKGGVVLALPSVTDLPLYFTGLGESIDALKPFDPVAYVDGLLAI